MNELKKNPLAKLIGTWKGNTGIDLAPKPEEDENNPYYEILTITPVDINIENAEEQELKAVEYHQIVREKSNDKVSHSETGHWIWDKENNRVMNGFSIPRGVCVLASGEVEETEDQLTLTVFTDNNDTNGGIVQSAFMQQKANTKSFKRTFKVTGNTLSYTQETVLDIYGKVFSHIDENVLTKEE
ncbi:MAG: FABP family protein [Flavobacteriaceae bacterium]|nr:FABP family protein [Flavobacteriaceae bacterium]